MIWSLRKKIFIGYGITLVLTILVFVWALIHLLDLGQASHAILTENYKSILAAENMVYAIERQDSATLLLLLGLRGSGMETVSRKRGPLLPMVGPGQGQYHRSRVKKRLSARSKKDMPPISIILPRLNLSINRTCTRRQPFTTKRSFPPFNPSGTHASACGRSTRTPCSRRVNRLTALPRGRSGRWSSSEVLR